MDNEAFKELFELAKKFGYVQKLIEPDTLEDFQKWLETKGVYIATSPELYETGVNWNWSLGWYLDKKDWEYTRIENEYGEPITVTTRVAGGTGWYGDNGEYPTRELALIAAITLGIKKLDPLFRNNSSDKLATLYGLSQNELLTKIHPFSHELGEWSFREFTQEQLDIIVKHLGNPIKNDEATN